MFKISLYFLLFVSVAVFFVSGYNHEVKEATGEATGLDFIVYGSILADQPESKGCNYMFSVLMAKDRQIYVFRENPGKPRKLGPLLRPGVQVKLYCDKSNIVDYSEHSTIKYGGDVTLENIIEINGMDVRKSADKDGD